MRFRSLLFVGVASLVFYGCETEEAEWVPPPYNLCVTAFARDLIRLSWNGSASKAMSWSARRAPARSSH